MEQKVSVGFWRRACAMFVDDVLLSTLTLLITGGCLALIYKVMVLNAIHQGEVLGPWHEAFRFDYLQWFILGIYLLLSAPYFIIGLYKYGTTIGKKLFNIKVVDSKSLKPLSLSQSILRFFVSIISQLIFGAGHLMALFHPRKQTLHDVMTNTLNIHKS